MVGIRARGVGHASRSVSSSMCSGRRVSRSRCASVASAWSSRWRPRSSASSRSRTSTALLLGGATASRACRDVQTHGRDPARQPVAGECTGACAGARLRPHRPRRLSPAGRDVPRAGAPRALPGLDAVASAELALTPPCRPLGSEPGGRRRSHVAQRQASLDCPVGAEVERVVGERASGRGWCGRR